MLQRKSRVWECYGSLDTYGITLDKEIDQGSCLWGSDIWSETLSKRERALWVSEGKVLQAQGASNPKVVREEWDWLLFEREPELKELSLELREQGEWEEMKSE